MISAMLALTGCNGWLDVSPNSEKKQDEQFRSADGFKDALTGVYIQLASKELYGQAATMEFPELLAQSWKTYAHPTAATERDRLEVELAAYDFTTQRVKDYVSALWLNYYKAILNINNILKYLDIQDGVLSTRMHDLIKGEALGLRAFLHLDILRLWGPAPTGATSAQSAIPYVKTVTKNPSDLRALPYGKVLEEILADLDAAEELLKEDPILSYTNTALNTPSAGNGPDDEWLYYRQNRFNYYAVIAAKARYYSWIGQDQTAAGFASQVIGAVNADQSEKFSLATVLSIDEQNLTFMSEHIFSVHNPNLSAIADELFDNFQRFTQDAAKLDAAYEKSVHPDDIRYKGITYWETKTQPGTAGTTRNLFKKYWQDETGSKFTGLVPVIRLSEMYFIAMEGSSLAEAEELFRTVRIARNMSSSVDGPFANADAVRSRLQKEYRKEFYGEGQMFFYYKRHNSPYIEWPETFEMSAAKYMIPIPEGQTDFQ